MHQLTKHLKKSMKKILLTACFIGLAIITKAQELKVITYNIHHGTNAAEVDQLAEMAKFIKLSGADLVGLQEVDSVCKRSGNVDQMKRLGELTGMYYAFARHVAYDGGAYGQGILSKYPIADIRNDRITLLKKNGKKDTRALISARVTLPNNQKVIFASVHFALDAPSRLIQASETINYLKTNQMPAILTGDLNTLPDQKEIADLEKYFAQTDREGRFTFPAEKAVKKIDYIFVSQKFFNRTIAYQVFDEVKTSDHLPVMATLQLKTKR